MNKRIQLFCFALLCAASFKLHSQSAQNQGNCGIGAPGQQWDNWFNGEVEKFRQKMQSGKTQLVNYTIPVVVHVVHYGETVGTYPNIDSNQVKSQIAVLN